MTVIDTSNAGPSRAVTAHAITSFPWNAKAVTKSDTDTFSQPVSIFVGTAGTVTVTPAGGQANVAFEVPAGSFVPVLVTAVLSTGTDASDLVAVY